jgi:hypothetical protein
MSIAVTCSCGKTYSKPEQKAGTLFRCHQCGRELAITAEPTAEVISFASQGVQPAPKQASPSVDVAAGPRTRRLRPGPNYTWEWAVAWVLIVLGLIGMVGGSGMVYIFRIINKAEADHREFEARMHPNAIILSPPQSRYDLQYGAAGVSIFIGVVLTIWGMGMRSMDTSRRGPSRRWARRGESSSDNEPQQ